MKKIVAGYGTGCCDDRACQGKPSGAACSKFGLAGNCFDSYCGGPNCGYFYLDCI